jgi:hypothetical protein
MLKLSGNGNECKPLLGGLFAGAERIATSPAKPAPKKPTKSATKTAGT